MSSIEITGKLEEVLPIWENEAGTFKKQEFILFEENDRNPDYSDYHKIELTQAKCDLIADCSVGDVITVQCNLIGRKWQKEDKTYYFTTLGAWRIEVVEKGGAVSEMPPADEEDESDLPF